MSRLKFNFNIAAVLHDAAMAGLSFLLALYLRLGEIPWNANYLKPGLMLFTAVCIAVFFSMRLYRGLWRYTSIGDMISVVKAVTLAVLIFSLVVALTRMEALPRSVLFINWMLLLAMLGGSRFAFRALHDRTPPWQIKLDTRAKIPVLLIGAGDSAEQFIRNLGRDAHATYEPVALIDDDPKQKNRTIHRVPIMGGSNALPAVVGKLERRGQRPQKIILTDDRIPGATVRHLLEIADGLGIPLARLPRLSEFKPGVSERQDIKPIAVEDVLGRSQNVLDRDSMQRLVTGKKVIVTGAGGTIGGELARQIASYQPEELILLELSEYHLYQIERELRGTFPTLPLTIILCDVRNAHHVDIIFRTHKPALVFHAAAIKHVPIAELNIEETILTNIFGTKNVAEACQKNGVQAMVMISTDKAVNPSSVMGATKRLAENFCQSLGEMGKGGTRFITVRFGNVLGSTGSVVPLFQDQLSKGGPLTVTHPDMTRYFMTVREAVELVLQAAALGAQMKDRQECVFVLDMGQPLRILDLAVQMIRLAGLRPYEDIKIIFTGLRQGEKLYEELFHFAENAVKTAHESIFLSQPRFTDMPTLKKSLESLMTACSERKTAEALALLKHLVPEFQSLHPTSAAMTA